MICFVIYGVNIYVSKHKFNSFEADPDPDPADQNEMDPYGSGTLQNILDF